MNFNSKKGVTVFGILIALVILTLVASTITVTLHYTLNNVDKKEYIKEYNMVKAATKDYIMRNSGIIDFEEVELDLSEIEDTSAFDDETIVENKISMYIIDLEKIGIYNTTYGNRKSANDVYLVAKDTYNVYYKNGFKYNSNIYYQGIDD